MQCNHAHREHGGAGEHGLIFFFFLQSQKMTWQKCGDKKQIINWVRFYFVITVDKHISLKKKTSWSWIRIKEGHRVLLYWLCLLNGTLFPPSHFQLKAKQWLLTSWCWAPNSFFHYYRVNRGHLLYLLHKSTVPERHYQQFLYRNCSNFTAY